MATPLSPDPSEPCLTAWLRSGNRPTLAALETILRDELAEDDGVPGSDNPIARRRAVVEAVNEVCKRTHCLHTSFVTDINAGQATYCAEPSLLQLDGLMVKDPQGFWRPIPVSPGADAAMAKAGFSVYDRAGFSHDWQWHASFTGAGPITLYPTPQTDRPGALWLSGYFMPGNVWEIDPDTKAPRPLDSAHECPVPDWALEAVKRVALLRRAEQLLIRRRDLADLLPLYERRAQEEVGRVESIAAQYGESLPRGRGRGMGAAWHLYG